MTMRSDFSVFAVSTIRCTFGNGISGPPACKSAMTVMESLRPTGQPVGVSVYGVTTRLCGSIAAA